MLLQSWLFSHLRAYATVLAIAIRTPQTHFLELVTSAQLFAHQ